MTNAFICNIEIQWPDTGVPDEALAWPGDTVTVHYSAYLARDYHGPSSEPFDSSRWGSERREGKGTEDSAAIKSGAENKIENRSFGFLVGGGAVVAGLERAARRLPVGAACVVRVPSGLAYGSLGVRDISGGDGGGWFVVPPYADLIFELEMVAIRKHSPLPQ